MFHVKPRVVIPAVLVGTLASGQVSADTPSESAQPPTRTQWTAGVDMGVAGEGSNTFWGTTTFHLGLRGDVMFGRRRNSSWGIGPGLAIGTNGFDNLHLGGMVNLLAPIHDSFPLVFSAGTYIRWSDYGTNPGLSGTIFWGSRSFNVHNSYVLCGGLMAEYKQGIGDEKEHSLLFGVHFDGEFAIIPALLVVNLFRSGRSTAPEAE